MILSARPSVSDRRLPVLAAAVVVALVAVLAFASQALGAQTYVAAGSFSGAGSDPGLLASPGRVAVEQSSGNVFVVDGGNGRVQVFDSAGGYVTEFGAGELDAPFGVAVREVLGETVVYVSDPATSQVLRYASDELLVPSFTVDPGFVSPAAGAGAGKVGSFRSPLAVDPTSGDLLVGDTGKDLVQRFDDTGAFLGDFDGAGSPDGAFTGLQDLAVDSAGDVVVVDANGRIEGGPTDTGETPAPDGTSRVERFDAAGAYEASVGPVFRAATVTVDRATDDVYVSGNQDSVYRDQSPRLHVFDSAGALLHDVSIGSNAQYAAVRGLAVNSGVPRVYAVADQGYYQGSPYGSPGIHTLEPAQQATLTIDPPTGVTQTTADFSGTVNPEGEDTTARFEISIDGGNSWNPLGDVDPAPGNGNTPVAVSYTATDLQHNTAYQVRLSATTAAGATSVSAVESFTTDAIQAPVVVVDPPSNVGSGSADLSGSVNPGGFQTSYRFEYSSDGGSNWSQIDPDQDGDEDAGNGPSAVAVSQTLEGLTPNKGYDVRIVATNQGGETIGTPQSFTTDAIAPETAAGTVAKVTHNSARIAGYVDPNGSATSYQFAYSTDPGFANPTTLPAGDAGSTDGPQVVHADLTNLQPNTTYYWRITATNAEGDHTAQATRPLQTDTTPVPEVCPNQKIRQQQGSTYLPGCRAYELVSPADKTTLANGALVSREGDRAIMELYGGTDQTSTGAYSALISRRTPTGWVTDTALPPRSVIGNDDAQLFAVAPDQKSLLYFTLRPVSVGPRTLWRYEPDTGALTEASTIDTSTHILDAEAAVSDDMRHVVERLTPLGVANADLYDLGGPEPQLIGLLPGDASPPCQLTFGDFLTNISALQSQRWISADGRRVFFHLRRNGDCFDEQGNLYMREDGVGGSTTLISGPPVSGPDRGARFSRAASDGSWVFYTTATRLDPDDANDTPDVYRYTIGVGNECLTCAVAEANVITPYRAGGFPEEIVVAENGSRVYFTSTEALAPGATAGTRNLYAWRAAAPDEIGFVAPFAGNLYASGNDTSATTTPEGSVLVFHSDQAELNGLTGSDNGGLGQFYRYDDRSGELSCMSCPSGRPASQATRGQLSSPNVAGIEDRRHVLTDDGRSFVFATPESLVDVDVNGATDVYEWRDGEAGLITDGTSPGSPMYVRGLSADGRDLLVDTYSDLTPGRGVVRSRQVYDARIDGGFALPPAPAAGCDGDVCQGDPPGPAGEGLPVGSVDFDGAGDLAAPGRGASGVRVSLARRVVRGSVFRVRVRVPGRGRITASGAGIRRSGKATSRAGVYTVRVSLTAKARRALRSERRLRVRARLSFRPVSGRGSSAAVTVTLKAPRLGRAGGSGAGR